MADAKSKAAEIGQRLHEALAGGGVPVAASKKLGQYIMGLEERLQTLEARLSALENARPAIAVNAKAGK